MIGQQQVVVKSIERNYRKVDAVMGATILGDGRVAFIVDVAELHRVATRRRHSDDEVEHVVGESAVAAVAGMQEEAA